MVKIKRTNRQYNCQNKKNDNTIGQNKKNKQTIQLSK